MNKTWAAPGTQAVYGLRDPLTKHIRYVGFSTNVEARYIAHRNGRLTSQPEKGGWVRELRNRGLLPELVVLEVITDLLHARPRERFWILSLAEKGEADLNKWTRIGGGKTSAYSKMRTQIERLEAENRDLRIALVACVCKKSHTGNDAPLPQHAPMGSIGGCPTPQPPHNTIEVGRDGAGRGVERAINCSPQSFTR